ncbi:MAG: substrate-binding domain-containing protein [Actinobacteria bacterium]|nr:substrate-binding domain-containing protein [Actinomycetota bacterium]
MRQAVGTTGRSRWSVAAATLIFVACTLAAVLVAGCGSEADEGGGEAASNGQVKAHQLILATTTSVKDSGLLDDVVLPAFNEAQPQIEVKLVAVGSGEAMSMGERGEADVLVVHSPEAEEAFMAEDHGTLRLPVARNYFAIVGPADDPAGVADTESATDAMTAIAGAEPLFVSRGDDSGTNVKELGLWEAAGVEPSGDWYIETGQGMGETLRIANEKQGYTLTDLGTYLAAEDDLDLVVLTKESDDLANYYSVIIVNQNLHPTVNAAGAEQFADLLVSRQIQDALADYGSEELGRPLFAPNAGALGQ